MFSQNFRYLFTPARLESWTVYEMKQSQTESLYVRVRGACSLVNIYRHLGGTSCLHFQYLSSRRRVSRLLIL